MVRKFNGDKRPTAREDSIPGPTKSALVDRLVAAIARRRVSIDPLPADEMLAARSLAEVRLRADGREFVCLIDDEFGDAARGCAPVLLNLVLMEFENYDGVDDFLVWARGHGLPAGAPRVHEIWGRLQDNQRALRQLLGPGVRPVSAFDWSLGAGDARALRALADEAREASD